MWSIECVRKLDDVDNHFLWILGEHLIGHFAVTAYVQDMLLYHVCTFAVTEPPPSEPRTPPSEPTTETVPTTPQTGAFTEDSNDGSDVSGLITLTGGIIAAIVVIIIIILVVVVVCMCMQSRQRKTVREIQMEVHTK